MNDYISVKEEAETVNVLESIHEIEEKLHPEEAMTNVLMSFFIILVSFLFTVPVSFFEVYASSISHEPFVDLSVVQNVYLHADRVVYTFKRVQILSLPKNISNYFAILILR